jgi:DNA (cytosine-5)-methyltransferase 1
MMQNGQVYALPMQERHTAALESLSQQSELMPTTRASEPGSTSPGYGDSLNDVTSRLSGRTPRKDMLPTPKARDSQPEGYEAGLRRSSPQVGTILKSLVEGDNRVLLRSPKASEGQGGALGEAEATKRGNTVGVRDQVMDLVASQGMKVSRISDNLPTPTTSDYKDGTAEHKRDGVVQTDTVARAVFNSGEVSDISWGKFEPAIRRWEQTLGIPAPEPTKPDGKDGAHRLSSKFTEWMMGLKPGHITDCGLTRNEELKAAGNGVVPAQAMLALKILLADVVLE